MSNKERQKELLKLEAGYRSELEENKDDPEEQLCRRLLLAFCEVDIPIDDFVRFTIDDLYMESKDLKIDDLHDVRILRGWSAFRKSIMKRDSFVCQDCSDTKDLQVHHARPVSIFPEQIYDANNCITLCRVCHLRRHRFVRDPKEEGIKYGDV